jgi:hypothetical protein
METEASRTLFEVFATNAGISEHTRHFTARTLFAPLTIDWAVSQWQYSSIQTYCG